MKARISTAALLLVLSGCCTHAQTCDVQSFISSVNQDWRATNYSGIFASITNRLNNCTNDLMALGLKYTYYVWAEVDFTNAQLSARTFVAAVSNQAPEEVNQPWTLMTSAKAMAEMTPPSPFPTNQARSAGQINYLHTREFPTNYPEIDLLYELVTRVSGP